MRERVLCTTSKIEMSALVRDLIEDQASHRLKDPGSCKNNSQNGNKNAFFLIFRLGTSYNVRKKFFNNDLPFLASVARLLYFPQDEETKNTNRQEAKKDV